MLDNLLDLVKGYAKDVIENNQDIPASKQNQAISAVTTAFTGELKDKLALGSIGDIAGLFSDGKSNENPLISSLQHSIAEALSLKVGLSAPISRTIASTVVPMLIKAISSKINDSGSGFNLEELVSSLGSSNEKGGVLGMLKGFFN